MHRKAITPNEMARRTQVYLLYQAEVETNTAIPLHSRNDVGPSKTIRIDYALPNPFLEPWKKKDDRV